MLLRLTSFVRWTRNFELDIHSLDQNFDTKDLFAFVMNLKVAAGRKWAIHNLFRLSVFAIETTVRQLQLA